MSVISTAAQIVAIVDDDADVRRSLESLLRSAGVSSLSYACAAELLASGDEARLGCVVTDLHMPGMTGLELQSEIARRGWPLPLIVMTAYPTDAARDQALAAGALFFLTKPIDPDRLLEAVASATHLRPRS